MKRFLSHKSMYNTHMNSYKWVKMAGKHKLLPSKFKTKNIFTKICTSENIPIYSILTFHTAVHSVIKSNGVQVIEMPETW